MPQASYTDKCVMFTSALPPDLFYRPLFPEDRDQGDPYVLVAPDGMPFRYYTFISGEAPSLGRAFPVYGSRDLVHWEYLGGSLEADVTKAHWAPCVLYRPDLDRPYVMLYSRGIGLGEEGHIGHALRRADSTAPEGPYVDSGHILTPDIDFAIDPDVYRVRDGSWRLAFAMDFVEDEPLGTGIVEAPVNQDLTALLGPPELLARAQHTWQVYDPARKMPWKAIPGIDWEKDTVRWHTVEAPVGGIVSPRGFQVYLYSGGCFFGYYAVGAIAKDETGRVVPASGTEGHVVMRPRPDDGFYAPGHCSWFTGPDGQPYLMFHARYGSPQAPRQMGLAPLRWDHDGLPYAGPWRTKS
jgi:arabinan endo-1,5-alpha-L-arabinosidase